MNTYYGSKYNFLFDADGYKYGHADQYPDGVEYDYRYVESRGGGYDRMLVMGTRILAEHLSSITITKDDVDEADEFCKEYGASFNRSNVDHIVNEHGGKLPLKVRSVREGTILPVRNVMLDVINTDPKCYWLPGFSEDVILRHWYMSTVASRDLKIYESIGKYMLETSDVDADKIIPYMLNDFGLRGVSSYESALLGGLAHLALFKGTDNTPAVKFARDVYKCRMAGGTVSAAEHGTITPWGRDREVDAYSNMVDKFSKHGILAVVSDSYNIYKAVEQLWCGVLLEKVKASGARVVIRPDSGDPAVVPVEVIEILMSKVGFTVNSKGYKVLPDFYRVIQGDGINDVTISRILENMKLKGISAENIVFGMGGGMLQQVDRDTMKFAMKSSAVYVNGEWIDVYKDPITDQGKKSKKGMLELVKKGKDFFTVRQDEYKFDEDSVSALEVIYENGKAYNIDTLDEIRTYISKQLAA